MLTLVILVSVVLLELCFDVFPSTHLVACGPMFICITLLRKGVGEMLSLVAEYVTGVCGAFAILRKILPPQLSVPGTRAVPSLRSSAGCIPAYSCDTANSRYSEEANYIIIFYLSLWIYDKITQKYRI